MVDKNLFELIWSSFKRIQGPLLAVLAMFLAIVLWRFPSDKKVGLDIILPISIFLIVFLITLLDSVYQALKKDRDILPRVILGRKYSSDNLLCLLEPSRLFSHDAIVSFYYIEGGFEQLIGIGTVINIQENGNIQVILDNYNQVHEDVVNKLAQNDSIILSKIIIKPTVPKSYIGLLAKGTYDEYK